MAAPSRVFRADPIRTVAFGGISGTYAVVGTPLINLTRLILFQNFTDVSVFFSFDGVNDHIVVPTTGFVLLDLNTNKDSPAEVLGWYIQQGTQIQVKQVSGAAGSGSVYVSSFYGR
jgi:hypothetical protein